MNILTMLLLLFLFGCVFSLIFIMPKKHCTIFYFKQYQFEFSEIENKNYDYFVKVLADIILKKIDGNKPVLFNFVNKKTFYKLKLNFAPTYKLHAEKMNYNLLLMYIKAFDLIGRHINLFVFDYSGYHLKFLPKNMKVYYVKSKFISYEMLSLINSLNINYLNNKRPATKYKFEQEKYLCFNKNIFLTNNISANLFYNCEKWNFFAANKTVKMGYVKFDFDICIYEHIIKKQGRIVKILNIFGEKLYEIKTSAKVRVGSGFIYAEIPKNNEINIEISKTFNAFEQICFKYLKLKIISADETAKRLNWLFDMSMKWINKTFVFNFSQIKVYEMDFGSEYFFKISTLKKDYLQRYYFVLKNIYGISLNRNGFFCRPDSKILTNDFSVLYADGEVQKIFNFVKKNNAINAVSNLQMYADLNSSDVNKVLYF